MVTTCTLLKRPEIERPAEHSLSCRTTESRLILSRSRSMLERHETFSKPIPKIASCFTRLGSNLHPSLILKDIYSR